MVRGEQLGRTVVEYMGHEAYLVKLDGSGRVSKRNRRFLKRIVPYSSTLKDKERVSRDTRPERESSNSHSNTNDSGPQLSSGMLRVGPDMPSGTRLSGGEMHASTRPEAVSTHGEHGGSSSTKEVGRSRSQSISIC